MSLLRGWNALTSLQYPRFSSRCATASNLAKVRVNPVHFWRGWPQQIGYDQVHQGERQMSVCAKVIVRAAAWCGCVAGVVPAWAQTVQVSGFEMVGNTLLPKAQLAYRQAGFGAVVVTLPEQTLAEGTVKLQVTEGKVGMVQVAGVQPYSGAVESDLPQAPGYVAAFSAVNQTACEFLFERREALR